MTQSVTRLTNMETGVTRQKDGRIEFYWVKPPSVLALSVGVSSGSDMTEWCEQNFGPQMTASSSTGRWFYKAYRYYFLYENDLTMFMLRYG